jgi:NAD(P)-dependent dehydrogenase (short-subunit alcohol dehydrogenase family)
MGELDGKIALITGAGSGIGRATALVFAREGATVACSDIDTESGEATAGMVQDMGGTASFVRADVSLAADVEAMVGTVVERYGRLDVAHNNAGIGGLGKPIDQHSLAEFERTMAVNTKSVFLGMKYQIPQMMKQGGGAIVNTASMVGLVGQADLSAYVASKHAVIGLTRSAALEYASKGVRINCICPGIIRTPINQKFWDEFPESEQVWLEVLPIKRYGEPDEVAEVVAWMASDEASFMHGHAMTVDGGATAQ